MRYLFLLVTVMSLTVFITYNTDSSDSENQVVAYAYGNCWSDWYYDYMDEEWKATYYRFAYAGVWAHISNWGWWDGKACVDTNCKEQPTTMYEHGVDDGVSKTVVTDAYWGDNNSGGRSHSEIVGVNANGSSSDKDAWFSYYSLP